MEKILQRLWEEEQAAKTCGTCYHWKEDQDELYRGLGDCERIFDEHIIIIDASEFFIAKTFGCNLWEAKEEE